MGSLIQQIVAILVLFIAGSLYPVLNSTILTYNFRFKGSLFLCFQQPWFQTLIAFLGLSFFIIPSLIYTKFSKKKNNSKQDNQYTNLAIFRLSSSASILRIISVGLQTYSLTFMPVNVWQIFSEFYLLFTALFAVIFKQEKLHFTDWVGLFFTVLGIALAGVSALLRSISERSNAITELFFSFILQILSHALQSFSVLSQENLLKESSPITLTAFEGLWGVYLIGLIILPLVNVTDSHAIGIHETTADLPYFFKNSTALIPLEIGFLLLFGLYRFSCFYLFSKSSYRESIYNSFLPSTFSITTLVRHQIYKDNLVISFLEKYSILEIVGIVSTFLGSFIYHNIFKLPCFGYSKESL